MNPGGLTSAARFAAPLEAIGVQKIISSCRLGKIESQAGFCFMSMLTFADYGLLNPTRFVPSARSDRVLPGAFRNLATRVGQVQNASAGDHLREFLLIAEYQIGSA